MRSGSGSGVSVDEGDEGDEGDDVLVAATRRRVSDSRGRRAGEEAGVRRSWETRCLSASTRCEGGGRVVGSEEEDLSADMM